MCITNLCWRFQSSNFCSLFSFLWMDLVFSGNYPGLSLSSPNFYTNLLCMVRKIVSSLKTSPR